MQKITVVITLAILIMVCLFEAQALPVAEKFSISEAENEGNPQAHIRVRRFTCDVLSAEAKGVKLNHAACALHCLALKRRGGYCNSKAVCVCR